MPPTPRIFISYSHDSTEHRAFVLACSNRLRADGLDCHIDQYVNGFPPEGWQRWMENQIEQADFVLMVCTPVYLQRYRGLDEDGGRGVTFEGVVISQHLYDAYYRNTKFVPVIPEAGDYEHVPVPLRAYNTYTLPAQYDGLYRYLSGQPEHVAPELGGIRVMPTAQVASLSAEPSEVIPDWAQHNGRDEFGRFAEIAVDDVLQRMRWIEAAESGFWMADTACTQALWLAVMGSNPAEFKGDLQHPVERVSWSAVRGFLRQLNQRVSGLQARLPTEAEWGLAAGEVNHEQVHCSGQATVAVKALPADGRGLFGMCGNVWEWCQDDFDMLGDLKVLRGGSWASDLGQCQGDARGRSHAGNRDYTIGFRFVV